MYRRAPWCPNSIPSVLILRQRLYGNNQFFSASAARGFTYNIISTGKVNGRFCTWFDHILLWDSPSDYPTHQFLLGTLFQLVIAKAFDHKNWLFMNYFISCVTISRERFLWRKDIAVINSILDCTLFWYWTSPISLLLSTGCYNKPFPKAPWSITNCNPELTTVPLTLAFLTSGTSRLLELFINSLNTQKRYSNLLFWSYQTNRFDIEMNPPLFK